VHYFIFIRFTSVHPSDSVDVAASHFSSFTPSSFTRSPGNSSGERQFVKGMNEKNVAAIFFWDFDVFPGSGSSFFHPLVQMLVPPSFIPFLSLLFISSF